MTSVLAGRPDYLQAIGGIDAEWATIEHALFLLFQSLLGVDSARAHAVFAHLTNHRLRRDILINVARSVLAGQPEFQQLRALDRKIERVALKRNVIAHATWGVHGQDVFLLDQRRDWRPVPIPLKDLIDLQMALRELYSELIEFLKLLRKILGPSTGSKPASTVTLPP